MIKHVSTRWLTLELAIQRSLRQYQCLKSYFLSEHESQARFTRLQALFGDPMTEVCLLFIQSLLPVFNQANKFCRGKQKLYMYTSVVKVLTLYLVTVIVIVQNLF